MHLLVVRTKISNASTSEAINAAAKAAGVNADELAARLANYGEVNAPAVAVCVDSMLPTSGSNWAEASSQRATVDAARRAFLATYSQTTLSASAVARAAATAPDQQRADRAIALADSMHLLVVRTKSSNRLHLKADFETKIAAEAAAVAILKANLDRFICEISAK
jgi:hypothetical protein